MKIHGDKYDYSKVEYKNAHTKVCIVCKEHGEFYQTPNSHLNGNGCPKCNNGGVHSNVYSFIERAKKVHGDKYDYSKVEYVNAKTKVCIICPIHGEFWQTPEKHLLGRGCRVCSNREKITTEIFVSRAKALHRELFDYSKSIYNGKESKLLIKCNVCGKEFEMTPHNHLSHKQGCPYCKTSKLEKSVEQALINNGIEYEQQKVFDWLVDGKKVKRFDFYLPKYNVAIECQGLQHFKPIEYFGGKEHFELQKNNDELKIKLCEEHGVTLLHYSNVNVDFPYTVYTDIEELIKKASENND